MKGSFIRLFNISCFELFIYFLLSFFMNFCFRLYYNFIAFSIPCVLGLLERYAYFEISGTFILI